MNHYFYETQAKEKLHQLRDEGLRSQAFSRSGLRSSARQSLPRFAAATAILLALVLIWAR